MSDLPKRTRYIYLDYLDHLVGSEYNQKRVAERLRFDLLVYPKGTICMPVPSCVKELDTVRLLMHLDPFWKDGWIHLQLKDEFKGNPLNFFEDRINVLQKNIKEEDLTHDYEYVSYASDTRVNDFFGEYLPEQTNIKDIIIYEGDTDKIFRDTVQQQIDVYYNNSRMCSILESNTNLVKALHTMRSLAENPELFQRNVVHEKIKSEIDIKRKTEKVCLNILDTSFILAYGETSDAFPVTKIANQLTGKHLSLYLKKGFPKLYNLICGFSWDEVYILCHDETWRFLIECFNALINFLQKDSEYVDSILKKIRVREEIMHLIDFMHKHIESKTRQCLREIGAIVESSTTIIPEWHKDTTIFPEFASLNQLLELLEYSCNHIVNSFQKIKPFKKIISNMSREQWEKGFISK